MASINRVIRSLLEDDAAPYSAMSVDCDILDKPRSVRQYVAYMLDRTNSMFEWSGLPDTIPAYVLELYLQIFGYAAFIEVKSTTPINAPYKLDTPPGVYIFYGGIGGERDIYYRPKLFTAANPRLKGSIQSTILYPGDDTDVPEPCVLMAGDRMYMGLLPLFSRYAAQLTENDISIRSAQINGRAQVGIVASTDKDKETALKYLDALEAGKLAIIGDNAFLEGISVSNIGVQSSNTIIQLIELQQYLKASWYNELGLNVNFNMKREYMSEEEIAVNTDILLPLVDDMLACRKEAAELLNKAFGLNVTVEKSSAWANKEREEQAALAQSENEAGIQSTEQEGSNEANVQTGTSQALPEGTQNQVAQAGANGGPGSAVGSTDQGNNAVGNEGQSESNAANLGGEPADVTINININAEEVSEDDKSEASEKSEKPSD